MIRAFLGPREKMVDFFISKQRRRGLAPGGAPIYENGIGVVAVLMPYKR